MSTNVEILSQEPDKLFVLITTHELYCEGGNKTHIIKEFGEKSLCGWDYSKTRFGSQPTEVTPKWISKNLVSEELCVKCQKKAEKHFA